METCPVDSSPEMQPKKEDLSLNLETTVYSSQLSEGMDVLQQEMKMELLATNNRICSLPWFPDSIAKDHYVDVTLHTLDDNGDVIGVLGSHRDIFRNSIGGNGPPRTILISGVQDSGKSSLMRKIANDWTKGSDHYGLERFKAVLMLSLRDLADGERLQTVLASRLTKYYHAMHSTVPANLWLSTASQGLLILLDDYDEMTLSAQVNLKTFIRKSSRSTILMATRKLKDEELLRSFEMKVLVGEVELNSFTTVSKMYCSDDLKVRLVKGFFQEHQCVLKLVRRSPFLLHSACRVLQLDERCFSSSARLCTELMSTLLKRDISGAGSAMNDEDARVVVHELGRLFMLLILKKQTEVTKPELLNLFPDHLDIILSNRVFIQSPNDEDCFLVEDETVKDSLAATYFSQDPSAMSTIFDDQVLQEHIDFSKCSKMLLDRNGETALMVSYGDRFSILIKGDNPPRRYSLKIKDDSYVTQKHSLLSFNVYIKKEELLALLRDKGSLFQTLMQASSPEIQTHMGNELGRIYFMFALFKILSSWKLGSSTTEAIQMHIGYLGFQCLKDIRKQLPLIRANVKCFIGLMSGSALATLPYMVLAFHHQRFAKSSVFADSMCTASFGTGAVLFGASLMTTVYLFPIAAAHKPRNFFSSCLVNASIVVKKIGTKVKKILGCLLIYHITKELGICVLISPGGLFGRFCKHSLPYSCLIAGSILLEKAADNYLRKSNS